MTNGNISLGRRHAHEAIIAYRPGSVNIIREFLRLGRSLDLPAMLSRSSSMFRLFNFPVNQMCGLITDGEILPANRARVWQLGTIQILFLIAQTKGTVC